MNLPRCQKLFLINASVPYKVSISSNIYWQHCKDQEKKKIFSCSLLQYKSKQTLSYLHCSTPKPPPALHLQRLTGLKTVSFSSTRLKCLLRDEPWKGFPFINSSV